MKSVAQKDFVRNQFDDLKLRFFTYYGYFYGLQKIEQTWKTSVETVIVEDALKNNSDAAIMGKCSQVLSLSRIGTNL